MQLVALGTPATLSNVRFTNVTCCYTTFCNTASNTVGITATYTPTNPATRILPGWATQLTAFAAALLLGRAL